MAKTILTQQDQKMVQKVINDINTGNVDRAYWQKMTHYDMNLLQAIYYAVRNGEENNEPVDNDLFKDIQNLGIGAGNYRTITGIDPEEVAKKLSQGLQTFK
ncbi:MAG: hypothetical protein IJ660_00530 [Alphaproteobacteria bacterium]|nr:hypothetical protein [Alphaproteobacteria bacterium]